MVAINPEQLAHQLDAILDRVSRGEEITIERSGNPIARLVGVRPGLSELTSEESQRAKEAAANLLRRRKGRPATQNEIRSWIEEGRR